MCQSIKLCSWRSFKGYTAARGRRADDAARHLYFERPRGGTPTSMIKRIASVRDASPSAMLPAFHPPPSPPPNPAHTLQQTHTHPLTVDSLVIPSCPLCCSQSSPFECCVATMVPPLPTPPCCTAAYSLRVQATDLSISPPVRGIGATSPPFQDANLSISPPVRATPPPSPLRLQIWRFHQV